MNFYIANILQLRRWVLRHFPLSQAMDQRVLYTWKVVVYFLFMIYSKYFTTLLDSKYTTSIEN